MIVIHCYAVCIHFLQFLHINQVANTCIVCYPIIDIYHQHSISERGGCFQWRLFVNTITSERLNVGWWNLAVRCIVQKSRPSSNLGSVVNVTRDKKNEKVPQVFRESSSGARSLCSIFSGAVLSGRSYAGGKISARYLVLHVLFLCVCTAVVIGRRNNVIVKNKNYV